MATNYKHNNYYLYKGIEWPESGIVKTIILYTFVLFASIFDFTSFVHANISKKCVKYILLYQIEKKIYFLSFLIKY